jgi:2-haloacid dehalogenase
LPRFVLDQRMSPAVRDAGWTRDACGMTSRDRLSQVDTLLLDTMGTVVDIAGSIRRVTAAVLQRERVPAAGLDELLRRWEHRLGSAMQDIVGGAAPWRSHEALRRDALEQMRKADELPPLSAAGMEALATVIRRLDPWPEAPTALAALRQRFTVVALSNADLAELAEMSRHASLAWHAVLSGQLARAYKPNLAVYRMALESLQLEPTRALLVAAHPWDLRAAAELGLATAYIARPDAEAPASTDTFDAYSTDLSALSELLDETCGHAPASPTVTATEQ